MSMMLKYFKDQIEISAILFLSMIHLINSPQTFLKKLCVRVKQIFYKAPAFNEILFQILYSEELAFMPNRLYAELEIFGHNNQDKTKHQKAWMVEKSDIECEGLPVILPVVNKNSKEEMVKYN